MNKICSFSYFGSVLVDTHLSRMLMQMLYFFWDAELNDVPMMCVWADRASELEEVNLKR